MNEANTKPSAKEVMALLVQLNQVRESLAFLHSHNIVQREAIFKGCKKFIHDHPQINQYLSQATKDALS